MDWKEYEKEIHVQFQKMYPDAEISHNVMLPGRYSEADRQIDILIEDYVAGDRIKIAVDGKYFFKKIDVKQVESFISMMQDVGVEKGLMITQIGYTDAAISRAYNDSSRIELDILNFEELNELQGFLALPFSGKHGVVLPSPFGWIIDATRREGSLASLYQRGLTYKEALENKEWIYVKIYSKSDRIKTLDDVIKEHESATKTCFPNAKFSYQKTISRIDANTLLRIIEIDSYPTSEYTGFVEFDDFVFFGVLFTPEKLKEKNIKKLEYIIGRVMPFNVDIESFHEANLNDLQKQLE